MISRYHILSLSLGFELLGLRYPSSIVQNHLTPDLSLQKGSIVFYDEFPFLSKNKSKQRGKS